MRRRQRWLRSGLHEGDRVRIPEELLISGTGKRLHHIEYVSETDEGLLLKLFFDRAGEEKREYKTFISWSTIRCGKVKLKDVFGNDIRATSRR